MNVTQRHISWGRGTGCPQGFLTMKKKPKGEERRKNWEERKLGKRKGNLGRKERIFYYFDILRVTMAG